MKAIGFICKVPPPDWTCLFDNRYISLSGYELIGVEKLPAKGPALLIYYHGALPLDMYYILARLILCKKRRVRNVAATFLFQIPGLVFLNNVLISQFHLDLETVD